MKLHLVDGTFELFRAYYSKAPKAQNDDGLEVGAVRALMRSMLSLLEEDDCTHVGIAFDRVIESFRNDLFQGYKTGSGIEPELLGQFPLAEEAARALGLVVWPMVRYEADDALATAAARFGPDGDGSAEQVVLCSPDKDLAQCVRGERVVLRDRIRKTQLDRAGVLEKFGVPPTSIPDYLALVGDAADGIPGIPRWGAKSTSILLSTFEHIEAIPADPNAWGVKVRGAATLAENLAAHRNEALLYRTLATLVTDVPLPQDSLDGLRWRGADPDRLSAFCARIGDDRFPGRVTALHTE
jgi:5'-3' exonuclease